MTTSEIIKEILDRHVDVTGYVVNADNIKTNSFNYGEDIYLIMNLNFSSKIPLRFSKF